MSRLARNSFRLDARPKEQAGLLVLVDKTSNDRLARAKKFLNIGGRAIRDAQPDHFGWKTEENASLLKIGVFRDNREAVVFRVLPYSLVIRTPQGTIMYVHRAWINIS